MHLALIYVLCNFYCYSYLLLLLYQAVGMSLLVLLNVHLAKICSKICYFIKIAQHSSEKDNTRAM